MVKKYVIFVNISIGFDNAFGFKFAPLIISFESRLGSFIAITPPAISGCIRLFLNFTASGIVFHFVTNMLIFLICFFTWFAHRKNIERMLSGDEHPTSIKEMVVKMKAKKLAEKSKREQ